MEKFNASVEAFQAAKDGKERQEFLVLRNNCVVKLMTLVPNGTRDAFRRASTAIIRERGAAIGVIADDAWEGPERGFTEQYQF